MTDISRDRWGRPLIVPPGGGEPQPYTRTTTFIDVLDDKHALTGWAKRMVAIGLSERPDLLLAVAAHRDDKTRLNAIVEEALQAARGGAAATTGTAIHALTERIDRGVELPPLPDTARRDLEAYRSATAGMEMLAIEEFVVHDGLKVGGTPDRIIRWQGVTVIGDVKTSAELRYGIPAHSMQLALYAHSMFYDPDTHERTPLPDVDLERGLIIHLPAGRGVCDLVWVDIEAGWEGVQLAAEVREWRARRGLSWPAR